MSLLKKSDLEYKYSWTTYGDDDPEITGKLDSTFLNRKEGYEVLNFINKYSENHDFDEISEGLKIEEMINEDLPGNIRSQENVEIWVEENWDDD